MYNYKEPTTVRSSLFSSFWASQERHYSYLDLDPDLWFKEFRPPTIPDLVKHLERFGGQRPFGDEIFRLNVADAQAFMSGAERAGDGVIWGNWLTEENLYKIRVPLTTSAGIRWKKVGRPKKGDALEGAALEASMDLRGLREGVMYDTPPAFVAGRGKLVDSRGGPSKKEGRLIVVPDLKRHLLGSLAAVPYSSAVKSFSKAEGGVMIGMGPFKGDYMSLASQVLGKKPMYFLMVDFSGYDQTVPAPVILASLQRISRRFEVVPGSDAYWESEYVHLTETKIVLPNGQVYVKSRGVSSGDPWTSQVGSEANWLMNVITFKVRGWVAYAWVFGDDVVIAVVEGPSDPSVALEQYTKTIYELFGLEVKVSDSYATEQLIVSGPEPVEGQSAKFLSSYFMNRDEGVVPVPTFNSVLERMLYPETNRFDEIVELSGQEVADQILFEKGRVVSMYLLSFHNEFAFTMLHDYWNWLDARDPGGGTVRARDWLALFTQWDVPVENFYFDMSGLPTDAFIMEMHRPAYYPPKVSWLLRTRSVRAPDTGVVGEVRLQSSDRREDMS
uniref:RdRp n=1 Tax=viral metagenome TaxID=1070528 RepID=A0A2V0R8Y5_9ZZZZ